jgi:hypothetical protein
MTECFYDIAAQRGATSTCPSPPTGPGSVWWCVTVCRGVRWGRASPSLQALAVGGVVRPACAHEDGGHPCNAAEQAQQVVSGRRLAALERLRARSMLPRAARWFATPLTWYGRVCRCAAPGAGQRCCGAAALRCFAMVRGAVVQNLLCLPILAMGCPAVNSTQHDSTQDRALGLHAAPSAPSTQHATPSTHSGAWLPRTTRPLEQSRLQRPCTFMRCLLHPTIAHN